MSGQAIPPQLRQRRRCVLIGGISGQASKHRHIVGLKVSPMDGLLHSLAIPPCRLRPVDILTEASVTAYGVLRASLLTPLQSNITRHSLVSQRFLACHQVSCILFVFIQGKFQSQGHQLLFQRDIGLL
jgi:hypothetical protein